MVGSDSEGPCPAATGLGRAAGLPFFELDLGVLGAGLCCDQLFQVADGVISAAQGKGGEMGRGRSGRDRLGKEGGTVRHSAA